MGPTRATAARTLLWRPSLTEHARELVELKREVVEARNQAIKTDNQVKNLTLDIKNFEKRFDGLEGRVRLSSVGVNLIVAVSIALAAWLVAGMRSRTYEGEIAQLKGAVRDEHLAAQAKTEALEGKLTAMQSEQARHDEAVAGALKVLGLLDEHQDRAAGEALDQFDPAPLSELERRATARKFDELRQRQAVAFWRTGRQAMLQNRPDEAIEPLGRVLVLDPNGRFGLPSRSQLGWALWQTKRYDEAEGALRTYLQLLGTEPSDEPKYLLGTTLLRLGKRDEGRALLQQVLAGDSRYAPGARAYLQAAEQGSELPDDLPGGRVRVSRRLPGPQPVQVPAAGAPAPPGTQG